MIVYIEDVLIENFLVTVLLLLGNSKIFKTRIKVSRLFLASSLGGIFALFYPLLEFNNVLLFSYKLATGVIIVYTFFGKDRLLAKYITFLLFTALYGGANILIYYTVYGTLEIKDNFATHVLIVILFIIYYIFSSSIKLMQKNFVISNFVYEVTIINDENVLKDTAFLDSGNTLIDQETLTPIFIINYKLFTKLYKNIKMEDILAKNYKNLKDPRYIKSGFASGSGKILIFTVDLVEILSKNTQKTIKNAKLGLVYSAFNKNFNCNMLLNINSFI